MRQFDTGATRDVDNGKPDYEGFLCPLVVWRFGQYMHKHRTQADGELRDSDNWQKGVPQEAYVKSLWRHFLDVWLYHRGWGDMAREDIEDALCAILFNVQGYLHELLKKKYNHQRYASTLDAQPLSTKPPSPLTTTPENSGLILHSEGLRLGSNNAASFPSGEDWELTDVFEA